MKHSVKYFDVAPLIVVANQESTIRIRPRFAQAQFPADSEIRVRVVPAMGAMPDGRHANFQ